MRGNEQVAKVTKPKGDEAGEIARLIVRDFGTLIGLIDEGLELHHPIVDIDAHDRYFAARNAASRGFDLSRQLAAMLARSA